MTPVELIEALKAEPPKNKAKRRRLLAAATKALRQSRLEAEIRASFAARRTPQ